MRRRNRILWVGALATLAGLQAGFDSCTPVADSPPPPPPPSATLDFTPTPLSVPASQIVSIDVRVTTTRPLQAYDVEVRYDPSLLALADYRPWADFDDDGGFFQSSVDAQAGVARFADLLHGAPSTQGQVFLATLTFTALAPGRATLQVDGEVAMPDGALEPVVATNTASINIR